VSQRGCTYLLPDELTPAALRERLAARLDLEADGTQTFERAYFDTFDGRVRDAGLALVWEAARLLLLDADDRSQAAIDWPEPVTVRAGALPGGRMRDLLAPVIDVRAATLLARVRVRSRSLRVLDGERKTVVRLAIEEPTLALNGRARARLPTRLSAVGVRGYDKALANACRIVEAKVGLAPTGESLVDAAVARAGGIPGGFSSKIDVGLRPRRRADRAAVAILQTLDAAIAANLPGTLADVDSEFLHDLRVAVRRTRALQRELRGVFPPADLERFRADFRWLQAVTGPTRDLDVYLLDFDGFAASDAQQRDLAPLRALLTERRRRERRRMVRALRSPRTLALLDEWPRFLATLPALPGDDRPDAARPVADVAARRIRTVYRRMVRMGSAIDDDSPPVALHDLRKKGKELRYLLEFFAPLFPAATVAPMVRTLKSLQDTLGRFQDREVQAATLRSLGADVAALEDGPAALMAMGVVVDALEARQAQARAEFAERFAPFAAKARRDAVAETFR
jgi:CHAD domain-containing protein